MSSYPISPDFRQRASSNASSCGRLSPRPTLDWNFSPDYQSSSISAVQSKTMDQLAGTIAEELKFQKDMMQQGFNVASRMTPQVPPPPYPSSQLLHQHQPHQNLQHQEQPNPQQHCLPYGLNRTSLVTGYTNLSSQGCVLHRSLLCACKHSNRDVSSPISVTTMSPIYPNSEPSSASLNTYNNAIMNGCTSLPSQNASIIMIRRHQQQQQQHHNQQVHPQQQRHHSSEIIDRSIEGNDSASTLIGQCMEALNSETSIVEFNIDNFQGGLECNIEELIRHEMSIDGRLDFNIPLTAVNGNQNIQPLVGDNNENFMDTLNDSAATTSTTHHQHINQLQLQIPQQQQTQSHNELPLMLNNMGLELSATQTSSANLNVRVQYTQPNVVTTPSFVH